MNSKSSPARVNEARALLPDLLLEFEYLPHRAIPPTVGPSLTNAIAQPFYTLSGSSAASVVPNVDNIDPTATIIPHTIPEIGSPSHHEPLCRHCEPRRFRGQDRSLLRGSGPKKFNEGGAASGHTDQVSQTVCLSVNSHVASNGPQTSKKLRKDSAETCTDAKESTSATRKLRCLCCQMDLGHGKCIGAGTCNLCSLKSSHSDEFENGLSAPFLNYQYWQSICDDLRTAFNTFASEVTSGYYRETLSPDSMDITSSASLAVDLGPIILELNFKDRVQKALNNHHTVVFWPQEQEQGFAESGSSGMSQRAPAIDMAQLDEFVKAGVWGLPLWTADDSKLEPHERTLWPRIRLFVGYCSIITNLATTVIQSPNSITRSIYQAVAAEFVYALGFRAQMLHSEICYQCDQLLETGTFEDHPAVLLYALETLYRLLLPMCEKDWLLQIECHDHRLKDLQQNFYEHLQQVSDRILNFQCITSDVSQNLKRCGHGTLPEMVKFSRSEYEAAFPNPETKERPIYSFPAHCVVTAYRHESFLLNRTPFQSNMIHQMRLLQVLTNSDDLLSDFADAARLEPPCHCMMRNNRTVYLRKPYIETRPESVEGNSCEATISLTSNPNDIDSPTRSEDASESETDIADSGSSDRISDQTSLAPSRMDFELAPALTIASSSNNLEPSTPSIATIEYLLPSDPGSFSDSENGY